ncbi:MAG TPA: universal stress protein [Bryobacteraceae bacterium]|jgi:nucleotide-binding universal stress UspA family protein|nr:universal stress protein [Bryobacteraceae bacterium]
MYPISRILVPVDFSDRCEQTIPYATLFAAKYNAEIVLLHVVNPVYSIPAAGGFGPLLVPLPETVIEGLGKRLESFAAGSLRGMNVKRLVYEGDPAEQVSEFAQGGNVQLIVMPTHGSGIVRRLLLGSVSAKILHDVPCPVLTSHHATPSAEAAPKTITHILCAIDLRAPSQSILAEASRTAVDLGAALSVVHVISPLHPHLTEELAKRYRREVEAQARTQLAALMAASPETTQSVTADTYVQEGEVVSTISSLAQSLRADLLVIGRGRDEKGRLKPTGYAIIREAPCAVLSV